MQQMLIIFAGLFVALGTAICLLPEGVSLRDAVSLAGAAGKLNVVDLNFDWKNRYNIWSGLIGGMFLQLSYFGTDQSQVQRYLTGKSIAQSRLSLLFNAVAKVPMQFLVLFTGAMVFVFFIFERPPLLFQQVELNKIQSRAAPGELEPISRQFNAAFEQRKQAAQGILEARRQGDQALRKRNLEEYREAQKQLDAARRQSAGLVEKMDGPKGFNDTNYIFLSFVTRYMPAGIVGLILAAVFAAAMSSSSGEINSLATVTIIDIYRRHIRKDATDRHIVRAARIATAFWGCYAIAFAQYGKNLGALIEAVNIVGSLFYGGMLGVFVLAFYFPRVRGTAAFTGVLAGEAAIFYAHFFSQISFLWYNVIGCLVVVGTALAITLVQPRQPLRPLAC
jgi:Na+/proline symporter